MKRASKARGPLGYLSLLLHAHLPYVRHPEMPRCLEENWLFEAITETYVPLLRVFERLAAEGVGFRLTLSLSPTLVGMLQDPLLQQRYRDHMDRLIRLARRELVRTQGDVFLQPLARMYLAAFEETVAIFEDCRGDLVEGFRRLQRAGCLELITCAATHGFLPLLKEAPGAVRAQLAVAAEHHAKTFGRAASGIWLPECGYYPGLEEKLADYGFGWLVVDTHGLLNAEQPPWYGVYAPVSCGNGVVAFGRDPESAGQVWSAVDGYPGHSEYREFHRDIGFDLPYEDLAPMLVEGEPRFATGLKYFRVTGRDEEVKRPYDPVRARRRAEQHALHFLCERRVWAARLRPRMDRPPMMLAPYDAELFGHWWLEGPLWLECLLRRIHEQEEIEMLTPSDYLRRHPVLQRSTPSASSWGEHGYNGYWLNRDTEWIYPHLHQASASMRSLAAAYREGPAEVLARRALSQAARSLLLAQASDWAFMMKAGTTADYARRRTRDHLSRFRFLARSIEDGCIDDRQLRGLEELDNIFPDLDYRVFLAPEEYAVGLQAGRSSCNREL